MLRGLFVKRNRYENEDGTEPPEKKKYTAVIFVIIVAICILVFSGGGKNKKEALAEPEKGDDIKIEEYAEKTEKRLKNVLSEINGAGEVEVMVSFENMNEKVLAKNNKNKSGTDTEEGKKTESTDREESVFIFGSGSAEQPFILKEKIPVPSGVLVVASGAGDEKIRNEIYEAVKALYGVPAHRVKVTQLKFKQKGK